MESLDIFAIDGLDADGSPAITKYGYDHLDDDPAKHRWRAWWSDYNGGIELRAYPVVRKTHMGAWIDDLAWLERYKDGHRWNFSGLKGKFVYDNRQQSWAKGTQEEAIKSIAIRLCRWTNHIARNTEKATKAAKVLSTLRPDLDTFACQSLENLGLDK